MLASFLKSFFRLAIVLLLGGGAVVAGRSLVKRKQAALLQAPKFATGPVPVRVVEARRGDLPIERQYLAVVEPDQTAKVAARVTAKVDQVACDEGDHVKTGQVVVTLDSREIRAHIEAVEAQIRQSEEELQSNEATVATLTKTVQYWQRELARDLAMQKDRAVADAEVDSTSDKLQEAQGKLAAARHKSTALGQAMESLKSEKRRLETTCDYCSIRSPFDGLLTRRMVDPGDLATPGKILVVIEDRRKLKLAFEVPQDDLTQVRAGLEVTFTAGGKRRRAKLSRLYPALNVARMLRAEVDLPGQNLPGLASGIYLPVSVMLRTLKDTTLIPASSLIDAQDSQPEQGRVFVVEKGHLASRPVRVLASRANTVAVTGVAPGAQVVVNPFLGWARYASGQAVEIVP